MPATRQFLVTLPDPPMSSRSDVHIANAIAHAMAISGGAFGQIAVIPLPNLAADDTDLEIGFRTLSAALRRWDQMNEVCAFSEPVALSRDQIAALVAELSKQHPARTSRVDHAALDAMRAIRESDKRPGRQVQKDARVQLIITDAICRCVPEGRA